jgi:hypothetical protein
MENGILNKDSKASAAVATAGKTPQRPAPTFTYVDRADCLETFADTVTGLSFDGQTLRLEFAVSRMDDVKQGAPMTGRRYPVTRLVLPPLAAIDLINKMQQIAQALTQAGVVKQNPATAPGAPAAP